MALRRATEFDFSAAYSEAMSLATTAVPMILEGTRLVVDNNLPQLTAHLHTIQR